MGTSGATAAFLSPPVAHTPDGRLRRVGFELELAGLAITELAEVVRAAWGGEVELDNPHRLRVRGSRYGDVGVELDWTLLSEGRVREKLRQLEPGEELLELAGKVEATVGDWASSVVPLEIVTPPLPIDELQAVEDLRRHLAERGAQGTEGSVAWAFGLHMNPEAPSHEAGSILRHLQAFLLLDSWIRREQELDVSRRVTPYVRPFPRAYADRLLAIEEISRDELIDGYLADNPTRNRALDLLPLLAHLDGERVRAGIGDELVNARPTYHYRLPGSKVGDPTWRIADDWNRWVLVERLAASPRHLAELRGIYFERRDKVFGFLESWPDAVDQWLSTFDPFRPQGSPS